MIPFIDITRTEAGFGERWIDKVAEMSKGALFIGGAEVATLEARLAEVTGVGHVVGCANGTEALQLALRALGVGRGDVVLVPDMTFWATFEAVVNVNADPVTVDVSMADGGVDLAAFERALIEARPKAAIIAHLYGWGSRHLGELRELCVHHEVHLVEDGAQSFGVAWQGQPIYSGAQIATTSFYPAKVLGAAGDGGAVFTQDADLAGRVRRLANHGRTSHYGYGDVGWNSRLDALQAAFLNISLDYIERRIASRRGSAAYYRENLAGVGLGIMPVPEGYEENGYCNVVLVADAERKVRIERLLKDNKIGFANIYPGPVSLQTGAAPYLKGRFGGEAAISLCEQVLNLPLFPYMEKGELDRVIALLRSEQALQDVA